MLKPDGSFFLNVGAAPSNPMLPHELVLRLRDLFRLQNTIHWIKAITIEDEDGVSISRGHFKPISSPRFLNDCHEYIFHLHPERNNADRSARPRRSVRGQEQHRALVAHARARSSLPRQYLVRSLPNHPASRERAPASGHISGRAGGELHQAARRQARRRRCSIRFSALEIPPSPRNDAE